MLRQEIRRCTTPASVPPQFIRYVWAYIFVTVEWHEYFNAGLGEGLRSVQLFRYLIYIELLCAVSYLLLFFPCHIVPLKFNSPWFYRALGIELFRWVRQPNTQDLDEYSDMYVRSVLLGGQSNDY